MSLPMSAWPAAVPVRKYEETLIFEVLETSLRKGSIRVERSSGGCFDLQIGAIVPNRAVEISSQSIYKNLVLVEFEDDIWQPPIAFALDAVPVAC